MELQQLIYDSINTEERGGVIRSDSIRQQLRDGKLMMMMMMMMMIVMIDSRTLFTEKLFQVWAPFVCLCL